MRVRALVPPAVLVLTGLTVLAVLLDVGTPLQPVLVGLFLVLAPGAALMSGAPAWPTSVWLSAVLLASTSVDVLVVTALFYLHWWSPEAVLTCLAVLSVWCALPRVPLRAPLPLRSRS